MIEIEDIVDGESLKRWLLQQPEEVADKYAAVLVYRIGMRLVPRYFLNDLREYTTEQVAEKFQTAWHVLILSRASCFKSSEKIRMSAYYADEAFGGSDIGIGEGFLVDVATVTAQFPAANTLAAAASSQVIDSSHLQEELWSEIRNDFQGVFGGNKTENRPLWQNNADPLAEVWSDVKATLGDSAKDWQFWIDWYEAVLHGKPQNADLLYDVALIDDAVWEQGLEAVNAAIADIQVKHLSKNAPLAEKLDFDPVTAKFYATPIEIQNPPLLSVLLSRVEDALEDALLSNGMGQASPDVRVLNRTLTKYAADPQRVEMDFTSVAVSLRRQFVENNYLPDSPENLGLLNAVEEAVRGIRATHPEVAENRNILAAQQLRELPGADKAVLAEAEEVFVAISQGAMADDFAADIPELVNDALLPLPDGAPRLPAAGPADDFAADIPELVNDALLPLPDGAPRLPAAGPAVRVFGRVSRMQEKISNEPDVIEKIEQNKVVRGILLAGGVGGFAVLLWPIIQIGLRVFGVL